MIQLWSIILYLSQSDNLTNYIIAFWNDENDYNALRIEYLNFTKKKKKIYRLINANERMYFISFSLMLRIRNESCNVYTYRRKAPQVIINQRIIFKSTHFVFLFSVFEQRFNSLIHLWKWSFNALDCDYLIWVLSKIFSMIDLNWVGNVFHCSEHHLTYSNKRIHALQRTANGNN